ncbi:LysR family transcriptional regulator [Novacetimonas hansenii]
MQFHASRKKLETSQSAVHNTIRRMEERLDVRLLIRTTREAILSEAA